METAKAKAAVLIEALPYLQMFRGRTVVVKFGGAAMNPQGDLADILFSVVFLSQFMPSTMYPIRRELRTMVNAAIVDSKA